MTAKMVRQTSWSAGEIDAINYKRTDSPFYMQAAKKLQNMIVQTTGPITKRLGMERINDVSSYASSDAVLFKVRDKNNIEYLLIAIENEINIFDENFAFHSTLVTTYTSEELREIDYTLDNDSVILVHPAHAPARVFISSYSPVVFKLEDLNFSVQPSFDFDKINYNPLDVTYSVVSDVITFKFINLLADPGFTTAWEGGLIIGKGADPDDPIGYAIIETVTPWTAGPNSVVFTGKVKVAFSAVPPNATGNDFSVRQPLFTSALGYPQSVTFYQDRLWFGGTPSVPQGVFGSQLNKPTGFDTGVGNPADAIVYLIGESETGRIVALNGGKQLEIYTTNNEYVAPQSSDESLVPQSFSIRLQSSYGSEGVCKPVTYKNDSFYVSKSGNSIIAYVFNGLGEAYTSSNATLQSQHLVKNPLNRALQRSTAASQDNFVYYLNNDHTITTLMFNSEDQLHALTPIEFQENIELIDIVELNNETYLLKKYVTTKKYYIEKFSDAVYLDGYFSSTLTAPSGDPPVSIITGLNDYDGYSLTVWFDNQNYGTYVVGENTDYPNSIVVDNPSLSSGDCILGLPYEVDIETLGVFAGSSGADAQKLITRVYVDYDTSLEFKVNGKFVPYVTPTDLQSGVPIAPKSGTEILDVSSGFSRDETISITQSSPFGLTIVSIGYQITGGYL